MTALRTAARAIADLTEGTIFAEVEIAVPPERVFRALTDPEEIVRWWGSPDTYRLTDSQADVRVGGRWRTQGVGSDGVTFGVEGEYVAVEPPTLLVQTWRPDWDGGHTTTIRYQLQPIDGGTRVTVRHDGFAGRPQSCQMHGNGWQRVLDWLAAHVAPASATKAAPAEQHRFYMCRLVPPRPTFITDMTAEERQVMAAHAAYWTELLGKGVAVVFGPVADPKGGWGLGVVRARDEAELRRLQQNDPAVLAGIGLSYEALPMLAAVYRA